jgi:UDP-N-acetyl-D-glucosamine dehydrogenase
MLFAPYELRLRKMENRTVPFNLLRTLNSTIAMNLLKIIQTKEAHIGVIGLGYVGLPLVIEFCKAGFHVTGFDIDKKKVQYI